MKSTSQNVFLKGSLIALYQRTASPIIMALAVHGFIAIADAWFRGRFVGAEALAAVTLIFPFYMGVVALSELVSAGLTSLMARHLGAGAWSQAGRVFAAAHGLSMALRNSAGPSFRRDLAGWHGFSIGMMLPTLQTGFNCPDIALYGYRKTCLER